MPLIATPVSHLFENKGYAKKISEVSDCLEVRQRSLDSELQKQWLFHVDIDITLKWDDKTRAYLQYAFNKKADLKLVTFQATRCCQKEYIENEMLQLSGEVYTEIEMLAHARDNTKWLRGALKKDIKIGLENNNYYPTLAYSIVTEGRFLSKVVDQNGLYLLLDIAHAMVTAHNTNISYNEYIESLPLDKLIQLHICQPYISDGEIATDEHSAPNNDMFNEVISLVEKHHQIEYLTVEFYKDVSILIQSIVLLRKKMKREQHNDL